MMTRTARFRPLRSWAAVERALAVGQTVFSGRMRYRRDVAAGKLLMGFGGFRYPEADPMWTAYDFPPTFLARVELDFKAGALALKVEA